MSISLGVDREVLAAFCGRHGIRRLALFGSLSPGEECPSTGAAGRRKSGINKGWPVISVKLGSTKPDPPRSELQIRLGATRVFRKFLGARYLQTYALVFTITLLLLLINRYSIWRDEALTASLMRNGFSDLLQILRTTNGSEVSQPLYYVVLWPWTRLFGDSEVALRLPSIIAMVVAVWVMGRILARIEFPRPGQAAMCMLGLPIVLWYALEARPYALIVLVCSLHLLESLRLIQNDASSYVPLSLLTLAVTASFTVAGTAALMATGVVWFLRVHGAHRASPIKGPLWAKIASALPLLGSVGLIMLSLARMSEAGGPKGREPIASIAYSGYEFVFGRSIAYSVTEIRNRSLTNLAEGGATDLLILLGASAVLIVVLMKAFLGTKAERRSYLLLLPGCWIITVAGFLGLTLLTGIPLLGRHLLFALPAVFLVLSMGLQSRPAADRLLASIAIWGLGFLAVGGMVLTHRYDKEDFRRLTADLARCGFEAHNTAVAAPVHGLAYYDPTFRGQPTLSVDEALELLKGNVVKAVVIDLNHADPGGNVSSDAIDDEGFVRIDHDELRIVTNDPLTCSPNKKEA